ncbi:MAG: co-chaperone GroES [Rubricoccaceae bacterium]
MSSETALSSLIVVGDRVLIRPDDDEQTTGAGLLLPASVRARERVQGGRIVRVGPGHLIPNPDYSDAEPWAPPREAVRYLPLQAQAGDYALFLRKEAVELTFGGEELLIVPHGALLALVRPAHPEDEDHADEHGDVFGAL